MSIPIQFSMRVLRRPEVLVNELEGECVILNLTTERYFGLDEVGTSMWSALMVRESIEAAYLSLLDEFDVDKDLLRKDMITLIDQLITHELVEIKAAGEEVTKK
jgi:hypothetical protein